MQKWQTTFCTVASLGGMGRRSMLRLYAMAPLPSGLQDIVEAAVNQFVDGHGVDVAALVDHELELREVLRGVPPYLQSALLDVEAAVVAGAVQRSVLGR